MWKTDWEATHHGRSFAGHFTHFPDPFLKVNKRQFVSTISQLRTGHGYFNTYLARVSTERAEQEGCSCGAEQQTPDHLLYDCTNFKEQRKELLKECATTHSNTPLRHINLLYDRKAIRHLEAYLRNTGIATRRRGIETGTSQGEGSEDGEAPYLGREGEEHEGEERQEMGYWDEGAERRG